VRKMLLAAAVLLTAGSQYLMAEPLTLEQAGNVLKPNTLEVGLNDISYMSDDVKLTNSAGTVVATLTDTNFVIPAFARYDFTPNIEAAISIPYSSVSFKSDITGGASTTSSDSGLVDPKISGKYSCMYNGWNVAGQLGLSIPMGSKSTVVPGAFREGFNIQPLLAATKDVGPVVLDINLSYNMTGEFTDETSVKQDPGDVLSLGVGAEKLYKDINWCAEFVFNNLSSSSINSTSVSGSSGSQMDLVLGGRYNKDNIKTKLGIDLSLGDEQFRAYDYRIVAGITWLVNI